VELADLATTSGEWLRGAGADPDVVDVVAHPPRAQPRGLPLHHEGDRGPEVGDPRARPVGGGVAVARSRRWFVDVASSPNLETRFLVERHLISRELAMARAPAAPPSTPTSASP